MSILSCHSLGPLRAAAIEDTDGQTGVQAYPLASKQTQTCFNTAGFQSPLQFAVLFNDVDFVVQRLHHGEIDVYQATGAIQTYFGWPPTKSEG